jgi:hypothetical protein
LLLLLAVLLLLLLSLLLPQERIVLISSISAREKTLIQNLGFGRGEGRTNEPVEVPYHGGGLAAGLASPQASDSHLL